MGWHDGWGMMGGGWLMWLLLLIVIGLVVWVVMRTAAAGSATTPTDMSQTPRETPLDILEARYARGEITQEEYQRMRADLQK